MHEERDSIAARVLAIALVLLLMQANTGQRKMLRLRVVTVQA
jgi:hypothetical protein